MIGDDPTPLDGDPRAPTEPYSGPAPAPAEGRPAAARLPPGHVLAGRYRIVAPMGRGGMGEVYRADDLKLDQPIALKRVPPELAADPRLRARLLSEVRIGRHLAHPNVCRLYDVIEAGGDRFISMELIDGEDLASLLRRIGRVPHDKGLMIAKELCAGLAAAHDQGVVHRDLKPANVMIDGRGRARITDLGMAAFAEDLKGRRELAGSPAYMAPEQLSRGEVTARSDLYALGLVLYELFTGRRLFEGVDVEEIRRRHQEPKPPPGAFVSDLDPAVEAAILACLEEDPVRRPASARAVMAALPGGDPLDVLVAAGETPSPGSVAAAGAVGRLPPGRAWALLGILVAGLALDTLLAEANGVHGRTSTIKSPEVLRERGRQVVAELGYPDEPVDRSGFFSLNEDYLRYVHWNRDAEPPAAPPDSLVFVYRESPVPLIPASRARAPRRDDPPDLLPGMTTVVLDPSGRLLRFRRVPSPSPSQAVPGHAGSRPAGEPPAGRPAWARAFGAAGLEPEGFRPAEPQRAPPVGSDHLVSWEGASADRPELPVRVEAASFRGELVSFERVGPWGEAATAGPEVRPRQTLLYGLIALGTLGAVVFARRNQVRGRVDTRGALRIAALVALAELLSGLATARHLPYLDLEWLLLTELAGSALFLGFAVYVGYLAVEPYARRRRPRLLIGWSRAVAGRLRDPLVGQEVLIGSVLGTLSILPQLLAPILVERLELAPPVLNNPLVGPWATGPLGAAGLLLHFGALGVRYALGWLTLLVLFQLVLRRYEYALVALWLVVGPVGLVPQYPLLSLTCTLAGVAFLVLALHRFGLLALAVGFLYYYVISRSALTLDLSTWFGSQSALVLLCLLGIGVYGFRTALGRRPAFERLALEREASPV